MFAMLFHFGFTVDKLKVYTLEANYCQQRMTCYKLSPLSAGLVKEGAAPPQAQTAMSQAPSAMPQSRSAPLYPTQSNFPGELLSHGSIVTGSKSIPRSSDMLQIRQLWQWPRKLFCSFLSAHLMLAVANAEPL